MAILKSLVFGKLPTRVNGRGGQVTKVPVSRELRRDCLGVVEAMCDFRIADNPQETGNLAAMDPFTGSTI